MPAALRSNAGRVLGDGLVLRWSTAQDTERIATLHRLVHRDHAEAPADTHVMRVIRRLMYGDHPLMGPGDFAVIEDPSREGSPIVACTGVWRHTWTYEGIPFRVGNLRWWRPTRPIGIGD